MSLLLLFACAGGGLGSNEVIDASELWPAGEGTLYTLRRLDLGTSPGADTATLDLADAVLAYVEGAGCADASGWRLTLRAGENWDGGEPLGALHLVSADGDPAVSLALCGHEDALAQFSAVDPALPWWAGGTVQEAVATTAGDWSVTATRISELATYYGVFPEPVTFTLAGPGDGPSGWAVTLAPRVGLVMLQTSTYTGDLVDAR